jgi:hypothetical protein
VADVGDSTLEDLDQRIDASRAVRREFEGQWLLNIAMYVGKQWLRYDGTRLYEYLPEDDLDPLIVDNRIQPAVRSEVAKITKTLPQWIGVPKDGTDEEVSAARLRERIFEHYWRALKIRSRYRLALNWSRIATAGFLKGTWDPQAGATMRFLGRPDENGVLQPVKLDDGRVLTRERLKETGMTGAALDGLQDGARRMGDVRVDLRSPLEMFPDALAGEEGIETCEYIGEESTYSREALIRQFGDKGRELVADTSPSAGIGTPGMPGTNTYGVGRRGGPGYQGIRVREYWSLPNVDNPNGRHVIWVPKSSQLLLEEKLDYPWLPYVMFGGTPVPGRFWPDCMTTQLVPQQVNLNKTESQISANAERIGNPPLVQSYESLGDNDETDRPWRPGERLLYRDSTHEPHFLQLPELSAYIQNQIPQTENAIREISRQYEVQTGSVPAGVTAASAISMLQEAGDTVLGPDIDDAADGLVELGKRILHMVKQYVSDERVGRIAGDDDNWNFFRFRGDQLSDCDIDEVQIGSGVPDSRAAKQAAIQQILNLFIQNGIPLKPRDMRRVLRDMEIGGLDHLIASVSKDETQIQDENRRLLTGEGLDEPQPVFNPDGTPIVGPDGRPLFAGMPVNSFDDDEGHIEGHEEMCKSPVWRELMRLPNGALIQQGILAHIELHRGRLAERAANLAAAQANPETPPPPSPGNGGPPQAALAS